MEDLTLLIAQNLKKIREEKRLSLDKLAELTGVSKSMLGQIERGESSPTVATVWKISNGLKVSFTSLLTSPQSDTSVVRKAEIGPLIEDDGKYRLYPFFPIEEGRRFEVYAVEIDAGGLLVSEAHPEGTQEFLTVFAGQLAVSVNGQEYQVGEGDAIRFRADRAHSYLNPGAGPVKVSLVTQYSP
jgi:XRE family transcriptional regulator, regulator of sulfur utilization